MRIDTIIESTLKNSQLKRVRIKVDPAQLLMQNFHMVDSYEGYILEEDGDMIKVLMMNLPDEFDPIQTVDRKHVSDCSGDNTQLITKVLRQLEKEGITTDNPTYQKIRNTTSSDFVDQFLRELGYDDKRLIELYKAISTEPVTEGVASTLKNITGSITKANPQIQAVSKLAGNLAKVPGLVVGRNNIIGRVAKFIDPTSSGFMKTETLLAAANKHQSNSEDALQKGTPVFVGKLPNDILKDAGQSDDITYQISGLIGPRTEEKVPLSLKIDNVYPLPVKERFEVYLDYPDLHNPSKVGIIYLIDNKSGHRYPYPVKVQDLGNRIVVLYDEDAGKLIAADKKLSEIESAKDSLSKTEYQISGELETAFDMYRKAFRNIPELSTEKYDKDFKEIKDKFFPSFKKMGSANTRAALEKYLEPLGRDKSLTETGDATRAIAELKNALKAVLK